MQHALAVLADRNVVVKTARGHDVFDDLAFERWLRDGRAGDDIRKR